MSEIKRITKKDFEVCGQCAFEKSKGIVFVSEKNYQYFVTDGSVPELGGLDKFLAAIMLKNGISEIDLKHEDLEKVDTMLIGMSTEGIKLMANRLPLMIKSKSILVERYNLDTKSDQFYWDFFSGSEKKNCLVNLVVVPQELRGIDKINYITDCLMKVPSSASNITFRPKKSAEVINLKTKEAINLKKPSLSFVSKVSEYSFLAYRLFAFALIMLIVLNLIQTDMSAPLRFEP